MMNMNDTITAVGGLRVGHAHALDGPTGCTVILCPPGTVGGVAQRGGAPGTRETDLLRPGHLVQHVDAILLAGGSAFGLDAAAGVMRYLAEQGIGFETPGGKASEGWNKKGCAGVLTRWRAARCPFGRLNRRLWSRAPSSRPVRT